MQWQPIKTAPKDGTQVLLCDDRFEDSYLIARYDSGSGRWWGQRTPSGRSIIWKDATHWATLTPPSEA